ncbi:mycofactocin biosynthesis glycosyltransferase MftF [Jiangella sp. DSM 45060]|uniref:mycofactocin biosynthesis glycosyltransferase MftF n=1 Tax=Jiangella sp. DSM 45060 TaxID=1798224 RepID=UPI00087BB6D9|nr:mycofactocin biosynthesis glycosyltransferase MftF [Jiangella sp. DSM 45060]SDT63781.1 mycofactocin system glycosyltransferase [Jiangella sp. DSM 45060]
MTLPAGFGVALDPGAWLDGDVLFGGAPFRVVTLTAAQRATVDGWLAGAPVGADGVLARALVTAGLALPVPPAVPAGGWPRVSVVVPVRDRPRQLDRLLTALTALSAREPVHEVIVVDDASADAAAHAAVAASGGARLVRLDERRRAPGARNAGAAVATGDVLAFVDSDCVPSAGWLTALLPHFADPEVAAVAPRVVALETGRRGWLDRYEQHRAPYDRGALPGLVAPGARVPFVPTATVLVRAAHFPGFDTTLHGGEDVDLVWRLTAAGRSVRYEPAATVAHEHLTAPRAFLSRRAYYGRTAAPLARRHPGAARPLAMSPWTAAAWAAVALRRPVAAAAITGTACALLAAELRGVVPDPVRTAVRLAGGGTLRAGEAVADAVVRTWWPGAVAAGVLVPRLRPALAAAAVVPAVLEWRRQRPGLDLVRWLLTRRLDDAAYGWGVWAGALATGEPDPLRPDLGWRLRVESADDLMG